MVNVNQVVMLAVSAMVFFMMMSTQVLPHFNTTYNYALGSLSSSTTQGLFLLVLVLGILGAGLNFMPKNVGV